jgi:hypothetical protein
MGSAMTDLWEGKSKAEILGMCVTGPDAKIHHQHGTIFDMARLFLTIHQEELHEQWLRDATEEALLVERSRQSRRFRNFKRAQARGHARERLRRAGPLAALSEAGASPESSGSAASVASGSSRVEDIWEAITNSSKS